MKRIEQEHGDISSTLGTNIYHCKKGCYQKKNIWLGGIFTLFGIPKTLKNKSEASSVDYIYIMMVRR